MIDLSSIRDAGRALEGVAHRTPVIESHSMNEISGVQLYFKAETLQRTGSFKFRGAYNALRQMTPAEKRRGVVTYSSGNHGQAVALSARLVGTDVVVVMPSDAPKSKQNATRAYGATIVPYDRATEDRLELASQIADKEGRLLIQPYDDERVITGQGTIGLELAEQCGSLDAVFVPVGGGGLISGISLALAELMPSCAVIGVEPSDADDTRRSLEAGYRVSITAPTTIADGLRSTQPGELTFPIIERHVQRIVTVAEVEIIEATRLLFERLKLVVEPSGACSVAAAVLQPGQLPRAARAGVILSGGNVDPSTFAEILLHR
ncbi:MAG TPA: threonine/serine dehydratase [Acidimicrobiales bacterium]